MCPASLEGGLVGIRPILLAVPCVALLVVPVASAEAPVATELPAQPVTAPDPCGGHRFTQEIHHRYAQAVYMRTKVRKRARRRMARMRDCALTAKAARNMARDERRQARKRAERKAAQEAAARAAAAMAGLEAKLASIASCESGGDPTAVSADGRYRGKYQFLPATWEAVGGRGDPAAAPETEQDRLAAKLYRTGGPGHWPVCAFLR